MKFELCLFSAWYMRIFMPNLVTLTLLVPEISAFIQTDKPENLTNSFRLLSYLLYQAYTNFLYFLHSENLSIHYKHMHKVDIPYLIHFQWSKVKRFA